ncbi:unnamed protein product [Cylindrotheca closterium]|uniref:Orc1-like AAA ATPase domain-containing protein n=1 Tax=Cylindrotheca closterium TaxID=2856 RepID=A0AAD2G8A9_9STRA|nr:unnamed protein product [Cylindrotheca closterium]
MVRIREGREFYDDLYETPDEDYDDEEDELKKLTFPDQMVGRSKELEQLHQLYEKFCGEKKRESEKLPLLMISGWSGAGKSALVSGFRKELEHKQLKRKPLFLYGKYDQNLPGQESSTLAAILEAFVIFSKNLEQEEDLEEKTSILASLRAGMHDDIETIEPLLPRLAKLLREDTDPASVPCAGFTWDRLQYLFKSLFRSLCSGGRPLILYLDDLQWADQNSLELIEILLKDQSLKNFMILSCVRSSSIADGGLNKWLSLLDEDRIEKMELKSLSLEETGLFISETLELKPEETSSLTMAVYNKTRGNIFSTIQALEELYRKEIIQFSVISFNWEWNVKAVERLQALLSDDVLEALISKVETLPQRLQMILAIAAYTRYVFEIDMLEYIIRCDECCKVDSRDELTALLKKAVLEGALTQSVGSPRYRFTHDKIRQALQSVVSSKYPQLIPTIGKLLYEFAKEKRGSDWMYFAASNYIHPSAESEDPAFLAELFLESGQRAVRLAAFAPASKFLKQGLEALGRMETPWVTSYHLTLNLHNLLADTEFNLGNLDSGKEICDIIVENASSLLDKLHAYHSYVMALAKNLELEKSKQVVCHVLELLGERPTRLKGAARFLKLRKVKTYFKKHSNEDLLNLPAMTDERLVWSMKLYMNLATRAFQTNDKNFSLQLSLKMIMLTEANGLCGASALGYALYARHLKESGDYVHAMRFAELAKEVCKRFSANRIVSYFVIEYIDCWCLNPASCLTALQHNHRIALSKGEVEAAFLLSFAGNKLAFDLGYPLRAVERRATEILDEAKLNQMALYADRVKYNRAVVRYLLGFESLPLDWDSIGGGDIDFDNEYLLMPFYYSRLQIGFYFGNLEFAERMATRLDTVLVADNGFTVMSNALFFPGLVFSGLARQTGKRKFIARARIYRDKMETLLKAGAVNTKNKLLLMDADIFACSSRASTRSIQAKYDEAISVAMKSGLTHMVALGSELAGEFFLSNRQDEEVARDYFSRAVEGYRLWGARAKVEDLNNRHGELISHAQASEAKSTLTSSSELQMCDNSKDLELISVHTSLNELPG